jgi:hypothetical protein
MDPLTPRSLMEQIITIITITTITTIIIINRKRLRTEKPLGTRTFYVL